MTIDDRLQVIIGELLDGGITLEQAVVQFEQKYIMTALRNARGNVTRSSRLLGVHRNTIHNRLRDIKFEDLARAYRGLLATASSAKRRALAVQREMRGTRRSR